MKIEDWRQAANQYEAVVKAATKKDGTPKATKFGKFRALDRLWRESLPAALVAQGYITHVQLLQVEAWKLGNRGKMRPLYAMVAGNSASAVETASCKAFKLLEDGCSVEEVLDALCELRGVGVATASAVLAAFDSSFPFMSDEAMEVVLGAPAHGKQYTQEAYCKLCTALRSKAAQIGDGFTARAAELAIYSARHGGLALGSQGRAAEGCRGGQKRELGKRKENMLVPDGKRKSEARLVRYSEDAAALIAGASIAARGGVCECRNSSQTGHEHHGGQ